MKKSEKRDLVFQLRSEVKDVKDCFTRFAFQGSALAVVVAGFILGEHQHPVVGLAALPAIIMLMLICRIGIFKYTTANRNLGYELHLDRLRKYVQVNSDDLYVKERVGKLEDMGWEEAVRAWRVVQASIFAKIYNVPQIKGDCSGFWPSFLDPKLYTLKGKARDLDSWAQDLRSTLRTSPRHDGPYAWWNQRKLTDLYERGEIVSHFYAGSFLRDVLFALFLMQCSLFALFCWSGIAWVWNMKSQPFRWIYIVNICVVVFGILAGAAIVWYRHKRITRRRVILEEELCSIHSCAITWGAVAIVHFAAAEQTPFPYYDYTIRLAQLCDRFDAMKIPISALKDICEGKLFFNPSVYAKSKLGDSLLINRRKNERRGQNLPFPGIDRRKGERRAA